MNTIISHITTRTTRLNRLLLLVAIFNLQFFVFSLHAQVNISGKVFGGDRQANVGGHTFVSISAQKHDVVIDAVYGGNDIAGTIGSSSKPNGVDTDNLHNNNELDDYNTFVRTDAEGSTTTGEGESATTVQHHLFIGQLFGGGYGDYEYGEEKSNGKVDLEMTYTVWDEDNQKTVEETTTLENIYKPEIEKAYVDLHGGTIAYAYGGGDNVTVKTATNICINNASKRTKTADETGGLSLLTTQRLQNMGINTEYFNKIPNHNTEKDQSDNYKYDKFLFSRVFGGNNKAKMAIRPTWHLQKGSIENLYSGGNEGDMISFDGLYLEIGKENEPSIQSK